MKQAMKEKVTNLSYLFSNHPSLSRARKNILTLDSFLSAIRKYKTNCKKQFFLIIKTGHCFIPKNCVRPTAIKLETECQKILNCSV